jgi:hypothetical protein
MTWFSPEKPEILKVDFSRSRVPMGGAHRLVLDDAQCEAGATKASLVTGTVKRTACLMAPAATSS